MWDACIFCLKVNAGSFHCNVRKFHGVKTPSGMNENYYFPFFVFFFKCLLQALIFLGKKGWKERGVEEYIKIFNEEGEQEHTLFNWFLYLLLKNGKYCMDTGWKRNSSRYCIPIYAFCFNFYNRIFFLPLYSM